MSKKEEQGWLEFILEHFEPGRATDVARLIEKKANQLGFKPKNKNKQAVVRQILPEHTPGQSKKRHKTPYFKNIGGIYYKLDNLSQPIFNLNSNKKFPSKPNKQEKHQIETIKDKSYQHWEILKLIKDYANTMGYEHEHEKENIDFIFKKNNQIIVNEIKTCLEKNKNTSYLGSIYKAIGQLKYYEFQLLNKYDFKDNKNIHLNIIGNFAINQQMNTFLEEININYFEIKDNKIPSNLFN